MTKSSFQHSLEFENLNRDLASTQREMGNTRTSFDNFPLRDHYKASLINMLRSSVFQGREEYMKKKLAESQSKSEFVATQREGTEGEGTAKFEDEASKEDMESQGKKHLENYVGFDEDNFRRSMEKQMSAQGTDVNEDYELI